MTSPGDQDIARQARRVDPEAVALFERLIVARFDLDYREVERVKKALRARLWQVSAILPPTGQGGRR